MSNIVEVRVFYYFLDRSALFKVCQVAAIVMETAQLVLSQCINF